MFAIYIKHFWWNMSTFALKSLDDNLGLPLSMWWKEMQICGPGGSVKGL